MNWFNKFSNSLLNMETRTFTLAVLCLSLTMTFGCKTISRMSAPKERLAFPKEPVKQSDEGRWYDVNGNGHIDFALLADDEGRLDILAYDDNDDGEWDRLYRISEYKADEVPHLIILVDSVPYRMISERYNAGEWQWFYPPQKLIAPFPSMSVVIFNEILKCPPMPGAIERYYDKRTNEIENLMVKRAFGYEHPWHQRLDYRLEKYEQVGMSYFDPVPWFHTEMYGTKQAFDHTLHNVTITYISTSSGMASIRGEQGLNEVMDYFEQISMQVLYERRGAVKISFVSDHGHNLTLSQNIPVEQMLEDTGYNIVKTIEDPDTDIVMEVDGLVTHFGVHTAHPDKIASAMIDHESIRLAIYQEADHIVVQRKQGHAIIESNNGSLRYTPVTYDVFGYEPVIEKLKQEGKVDTEGFISRDDWFAATCNHDWPDAPRRLWDTYHGQVISPPDVIFTLNDGYCAGIGFFDKMIVMASTHGGLHQIHSDAMVMTMTRPLEKPLRSEEIMDYIEPRYDPNLIVDP